MNTMNKDNETDSKLASIPSCDPLTYDDKRIIVVHNK